MAWLRGFSSRDSQFYCPKCDKPSSTPFCGECGWNIAGSKRHQLDTPVSLAPASAELHGTFAVPASSSAGSSSAVGSTTIPGVSAWLMATAIAILFKIVSLDHSKSDEHKSRLADLCLKRCAQLTNWAPSILRRALGLEHRPSDFGAREETFATIKDGVLQTCSSSRQLRIESPVHWNACWAVYMQCMVSMWPHMAAGLAAHQAWVNDLFATGRHSFASIYDTEATHRQQCARQLAGLGRANA